MKCNYCGTEISPKARFCRFCGTRLTPEETAAMVPLPAPPSSAEDLPVAEPLPDTDPAGLLTPMETLEDEIPRPKHPPVLDEFDFTWQPYRDVPPPETLPVPEETKAPSAPPALRLPTGRSLAKMFFLGILTLGIYPLVIWSRMVTELNLAASFRDGKRTMPYVAMLLLFPLTLGIYPMVWSHRFCRRIGRELERRELNYAFGPKDFWLWNMLGILILAGPLVYTHKLTRSMNLINADFNRRG